MAEAILDASAILAFLNGESGSEAVAGVMRNALVSTVNVAEVVGKLVERSMSAQNAGDIIARLPCRHVVFDSELAHRAGSLRGDTGRLGLSLGDRACLALAERERLPVLTTDRAWEQLDLDVSVRLLR